MSNTRAASRHHVFDWLRRAMDLLRAAAATGIVAPASKPADPRSASSGRPQGRGMSDTRILLVEDEPAISGFVRRGLIFEGYDVEVLDDGRRALDAIRDAPPDLLILDLMLPGLDGIEITRRLRAAEESTGGRLPILMLTARDSVADRVTG